MLLPLKKQDKKNQKADTDTKDKNKTSSDSGNPIPTFSEFIPYYCHYNPHTLLTKNGELLQTIKIATNLKGLNYESGTDLSTIVRETIRQAILENVRTDNISIWIHTIRRRKPIHYRSKFKEPFATTVHERWQQKYKWKYQYYNEVYASFMFDGQAALLSDSKNFQSVIMPKRNRDFRNAYLKAAYAELDATVLAIIARIRQHFNVQRLMIVERVPSQTDIPVNQAIFYSEPMEFLGNLLNLRSEEFLLPELDVSEALFTTVQTFGFNALETKNTAGKRRFGAILTLKQYREVPSETTDLLMQAPMEFIITQAFHFTPSTGALKQYKEQKQIFDISGDLYCVHASGIEDMMTSQSGKSTDFGDHQTSIMVLADEFRQLDGEIIKVQAAFADLGLITIREDVKLEECFWSQLPANFEFIRRRDTINTSRIAGFARLNRFPNGMISGNHWGTAVTIFPTLVGSPYFFNFHHQDNGHTIIFDFNSFNDQVLDVLLNFFISETRKFDCRLFVFDYRRSADLFFQKLGGNYYNFPNFDNNHERPQFKINPFMLADDKRNKSFLLVWCLALISPNQNLPDRQKDIIKAAIDQLYSGDPEKRNLDTLVAMITPQDAPLAKAFSKWHGEGIYAGLFDAPQEALDLNQSLHAFDMGAVISHKDKECIVPVFSYLLHRISVSLDGRPTMILLHEAWDLLENDFIAPRLESFMEMLQQNNVMMIFTTGKPLNSIKTSTFNIIMKNCATQLFLPDDIGRNYVVPELGLDEYDAKWLIKMDRQHGDFLLKQNNETIALRAELKEMDDIHAIFANDSKNLAAALGKYSRPEEDKS